MNSTSGFVSKENKNLRRFTSEFVTFTGTSIAAIRYPNAENVTITRQGVFFDANGKTVPAPNLTYDAAKRSIVTPAPVHGIALVEYRAPYELWRATFSGNCPSVEPVSPPVDTSLGAPDDDTAYTGRQPMVVSAWLGGKLEASLQLTPPACVYTTDEAYTAVRRMDAKLPKLKIEEDPDDRTRLVGGETQIPGHLRGRCGLRVYPGRSGILLEASNGSLLPYPSTKYDILITETLTFNGSSSASLSYQPTGTSVAVTSVGNFTDQWDRTFAPDILQGGDNVTSVNWVSKNTYNSPVKRRLYADEIAIANLFGVAVPCYGAVEVSYVTSYWKAHFFFDYNYSEQRFEPASFIAKDSKQTASLTLQGPTVKGFY